MNDPEIVEWGRLQHDIQEQGWEHAGISSDPMGSYTIYRKGDEVIYGRGGDDIAQLQHAFDQTEVGVERRLGAARLACWNERVENDGVAVQCTRVVTSIGSIQGTEVQGTPEPTWFRGKTGRLARIQALLHWERRDGRDD